MEINKVKTGDGLAGSRVALIFAPPLATPGSLVALTRFFNEQPHLRAVPGYHGPDKHHVLRISGLQDDARFMQLLQHDLPQWLHDNSDQSIQVSISPKLRFEALNDVDHFPFMSPIRRFVKENANGLTGACYIAGNAGLLYAGWRKPIYMPSQPNHDWLRIYSAIAYTVGSAVLIGVGSRADNPRDVYSIMQEIYPKLGDLGQSEQEQVRSDIAKTLRFIKTHPWEISSAISASGAAAHLTSALRRRTSGARHTTYEALSALGTLTAMGIAALVPEKEGRDLLHLEPVFERKEKDSALHTMETMKDLESTPGETAKRAQGFTDWLRNSPLAVSAGIQAIANIGYGVSAVVRKPFAPGLAVMSGGYLAGNAVQTQASKGRGPGFDDVVTAAASIVQNDPLTAHLSERERNNRVARFADLLVGEQEIVHDKGRLYHGIKGRLERSKLPRDEENKILTGFTDDEQHILKNSPFAKPTYVEKVFAQTGPEAVVTV